jgi:hypothetical protein
MATMTDTASTRERPAWVTDAASVYLDNAFRVLALPVTATEREVRARARERSLQLELEGADPHQVQRVRA